MGEEGRALRSRRLEEGEERSNVGACRVDPNWEHPNRSTWRRLDKSQADRLVIVGHLDLDQHRPGSKATCTNWPPCIVLAQQGSLRRTSSPQRS